MNPGVVAIVMLLSFIGGMVGLLAKCSADESEACRRAGGDPVVVRSTVICFAPGVVVEPKR